MLAMSSYFDNDAQPLKSFFVTCVLKVNHIMLPRQLAQESVSRDVFMFYYSCQLPTDCD